MKTLEHYLALNYHYTVSQDEDGDYVAEVQELSGCIADGETANEAIVNLREAMKSWIESRMEAGFSIPEPRSSDEYSGKVLLRMPKSLHRRLAQQAEIEGVSMNQYVVSLLTDASARFKQENQPAVLSEFNAFGSEAFASPIFSLSQTPNAFRFTGIVSNGNLPGSGFGFEFSEQRLLEQKIPCISASIQGVSVARRQTDFLPVAEGRNQA
jgi:antitoxin HicB